MAVDWGAVINGASSLGAAAIGGNAAGDAANTVEDTTQAAIAEQRRQQEQAYQDQLPWYGAATGTTNQVNPEYAQFEQMLQDLQNAPNAKARKAIRDANGGLNKKQIRKKLASMNKTVNVNDPNNVGALNTLAQYGRNQIDETQFIPQSNIPQYNNNFDLSKDPSYLWKQQEMMRGINAGAASMGKITSGNRLEEIMQRSGDLASTEYAAADARNVRDYGIRLGSEDKLFGRGVDAYGRAYGAEGDFLNRQSALSGTGQTAATNMGNFNQGAANNIGNALIAGGSAQAAAQIGQGNAWQSALGDIGQVAGQWDGGFSNTTNQPNQQQNLNFLNPDSSTW